MQMETDESAAEDNAAADEPAAGPAVAIQTPANGVDGGTAAGQSTESKAEAVGVSGAVEADEGPAVDANADATLPDTVGDLKASQRVAGVTPASDATPNSTVDAAEARRQQKQETIAKG